MPCMGSRSGKSGFSLVELLVVTVLLGVLSLTLFSVFTSGIRIWQRVNRNLAEEDLCIFLDKFSLDLRNSFKFASIPFKGNEYSLEFATLVDSGAMRARTVGKTVYLYEPVGEQLMRQEKDYAQAYSDAQSASGELLKNVKSLRFQYYRYIKDKDEFIWQAEWPEEELPLAVRMELEFDNGRAIAKFSRTVSIPVSFR